MHEINLTNFSLRTDLLIDDYKDIDSKDYNIKKINKDIYVEDINIKEENNIYKKKKGLYKTITFKDITDKDNFNLVLKTFIEVQLIHVI